MAITVRYVCDRCGDDHEFATEASYLGLAGNGFVTFSGGVALPRGWRAVLGADEPLRLYCPDCSVTVGTVEARDAVTSRPIQSSL